MVGDNLSLDLIKPWANLADSFLDEWFILEKSISIGCPKEINNPKY